MSPLRMGRGPSFLMIFDKESGLRHQTWEGRSRGSTVLRLLVLIGNFHEQGYDDDFQCKPEVAFDDSFVWFSGGVACQPDPTDRWLGLSSPVVGVSPRIHHHELGWIWRPCCCCTFAL